MAIIKPWSLYRNIYISLSTGVYILQNNWVLVGERWFFFLGLGGTCTIYISLLSFDKDLSYVIYLRRMSWYTSKVWNQCSGSVSFWYGSGYGSDLKWKKYHFFYYFLCSDYPKSDLLLYKYWKCYIKRKQILNYDFSYAFNVKK
mgnify:CR=1 FL=1